jgi:hypothetical protein
MWDAAAQRTFFEGAAPRPVLEIANSD